MAGALTISTLNNDTGVLSVQNGMTGIAKAWANFDGTLSSPITPRASFNIGFITKNGTGDYTVNFTTAMPNANYATMLGYANQNIGSYAPRVLAASPSSSPTLYSTTQVRFVIGGAGFDSSPLDFASCYVAIFSS
jgi:hypothetical protein